LRFGRGRQSEGADMAAVKDDFMEVSPADFFYRNRDIAGFSNPSRAIYSTVRELVENSLDACELHSILPDIYLRISHVEGPAEGPAVYRVRVEDNGSGVPSEHIPSAFGQILYGSKYKLRQSRGTFGLGGKMAFLYGQITTNSSLRVTSSTGGSRISEFELMVDIQRNRPIIVKKASRRNENAWHGTVVEFSLEADFSRAMPKIVEYVKQTAMVSPYANLTLVEPRGRLYKFERVLKTLPTPPRETEPHPYGVDVETVQRMVASTRCDDMVNFLTYHFHRVGSTIAGKFLRESGVDPDKNPKRLAPSDIVKLVQNMRSFTGFLPPDASCLSPLGEELMAAGIRKELSPEFVTVVQRKPATYSGFPFIVEVAAAYGGSVPATGSVLLYRFANRIPLLYDEASDVSWKVVNSGINWRHYKVTPEAPVALIIHICSTKVPYKSVGKEFIADRPEVEREILNGVRDVARQLMLFLSKRESIERQKKRLDVFRKYLPKIAEFSTKCAGRKNAPGVEKLLRSVARYGSEED